MKLIVGLGNPGEKYKNTRHNVGFMLVEYLKSQNLVLKDFTVVKSDKFMNESGIAVKKLSTFYKLHSTNLYIAHDDLDIKLGEFKVQFGKGPKVHNGITSVEEELGTKDFWRIRIGIENREPENRIPGEEYVLQDFTSEELNVLESILKKIANFLKTSRQ